MSGKQDRSDNTLRQNHDPRVQGTILDRIFMPPMSGEEALRRFQASHGQDIPQSELSALSPVMRCVAVAGTLVLIVGVLLGVFYLISR
ncbi:hypothetical protein [Thalassospira sp.]|uniref:hypothetical protein n=1 Tax=Thalassospira sp. TaxID=1912094 RepID=UPI002735AE67|nr:hypothetical protein [Thalassospira sp.]MDP2697352.1 hypothetical protein [Thalassospira sp.]